jgi:hypothetical protein
MEYMPGTLKPVRRPSKRPTEETAVVDWSNFTQEEIERRHLAAVDALQALDREEFSRWYQEQCDHLYWTRGQCCAGCDHWRSDMGNTGRQRRCWDRLGC